MSFLSSHARAYLFPSFSMDMHMLHFIDVHHRCMNLWSPFGFDTYMSDTNSIFLFPKSNYGDSKMVSDVFYSSCFIQVTGISLWGSVVCQKVPQTHCFNVTNVSMWHFCWLFFVSVRLPRMVGICCRPCIIAPILNSTFGNLTHHSVPSSEFIRLSCLSVYWSNFNKSALKSLFLAQ
jgi:hypothetical protein